VALCVKNLSTSGPPFQKGEKDAKKILPSRGFPNIKAFLTMPAQSGDKIVEGLQGRSGILAKLKQVKHCLFLGIKFIFFIGSVSFFGLLHFTIFC
jgi:hypothetical protein